MGKRMDPLIPCWYVQLEFILFIYKDIFYTKWPTKVDIPLEKETKPNQTNLK